MNSYQRRQRKRQFIFGMKRISTACDQAAKAMSRLTSAAQVFHLALLSLVQQ